MKNEWITRINIGFENCEVYSLPIENVSHIYIHENGTSYRCDYGGKLSSTKHSDYVRILINNFDNSKCEFSFDENISLQSRLQMFSDITNITFMQNTNIILDVYVPWNPNKEDCNDWQEIIKSPYNNKDLEIIIKNPKFEE